MGLATAAQTKTLYCCDYLFIYLFQTKKVIKIIAVTDPLAEKYSIDPLNTKVFSEVFKYLAHYSNMLYSAFFFFLEPYGHLLLNFPAIEC